MDHRFELSTFEEEVIDLHPEVPTNDHTSEFISLSADLWLKGKLQCDDLKRKLQSTDSKGKIVNISSKNQECIVKSVPFPYPSCSTKKNKILYCFVNI
jgi:hypothetical protein